MGFAPPSIDEGQAIHTRGRGAVAWVPSSAKRKRAPPFRETRASLSGSYAGKGLGQRRKPVFAGVAM